jgi:predicted MFS family arabinose efflux permease
VDGDGETRQRGVAGRLGLDALDHPPFRTFFGASLVSNTASFVLSAALSWTVLEATGSAASVGLVGFLYALPFGLFTLHAGLLTDRFGSRRMVGYSMAASGLITVLLGALVLGIGLPVLGIGLLALAIGSASVLGSPGGISIVNDLVPRSVVPSAVSLIFLDVNAGRIIGGLLGGALLAAWPSGATLLFAGLLLALPAVLILRLPIGDPEAPDDTGRSLVAPLMDAARYARREPILGTLLALAIVPGAIGLSFNYLLPVAAKEGGYGSDGLGVMVAAAGVGGLVAGWLGARLMRSVGHGRAVLLGIAMIATGLMAFGLSPTLLTAVLSMVWAGGGFAIYASSSLALVQSLSSTEFRGRLTAVFALLYWGLMPLGALIGGALAEAIGAQPAMLINGAIVGLAGVVAVVGRPAIAAVRAAGEDPVREPASQAG